MFLPISRHSAVYVDCTHSVTVDCPNVGASFVQSIGAVLESERLMCHDPCEADPCMHGMCVQTEDDDDDAHLFFYCDCLPGFSGPFCEDGKTVFGVTTEVFGVQMGFEV